MPKIKCNKHGNRNCNNTRNSIPTTQSSKRCSNSDTWKSSMRWTSTWLKRGKQPLTCRKSSFMVTFGLSTSLRRITPSLMWPYPRAWPWTWSTRARIMRPFWPWRHICKRTWKTDKAGESWEGYCNKMIKIYNRSRALSTVSRLTLRILTACFL